MEQAEIKNNLKTSHFYLNRLRKGMLQTKKRSGKPPFFLFSYFTKNFSVRFFLTLSNTSVFEKNPVSSRQKRKKTKIKNRLREKKKYIGKYSP